MASLSFQGKRKLECNSLDSLAKDENDGNCGSWNTRYLYSFSRKQQQYGRSGATSWRMSRVRAPLWKNSSLMNVQFGAGNAMVRLRQAGKFTVRNHGAVIPRRLPQSIHACAIRATLPFASGGTGSSPVMASSAQNHWSRSRSSSANINGTASDPMPIIL